jgi:hypothetical protein
MERSDAVAVKVEVAGGGSGSVSSGDASQGVHGWAKFGLFKPSFWIESFDSNQPERWMQPPP